jgi:hypothetical protein
MQPYSLVAMGSFVGVDPDRIIVKRILLTGIPVKVKRRHAVVKHMFFNPDDVKVRWCARSACVLVLCVRR